ncbi:DUF309 domain-containing protein [Staphylococcus sp. 17KM0847]|uniref:DUF309 domain-containing protein n=1 Tax=Staphylococcus sp. 17KM0847 TaxID=2583989 RepID=UPI0015DD03F9|nr:DUF309 domain-containing protein [Staphylococcus sp. 17KM0847]QLK86118.1 DUF309 domain-containing protein [Staphylococcus sp. 17KM0847]
MQHALIDFYYQFHTKQHYFLCHDILEEAWKAQPHYSKNDMIVSLILFATASYHYRRQNFIGARRLYQKAYDIVEPYDDDSVMLQLGIEASQYRSQLNMLIEATHSQLPFSPIALPITHDMKKALKRSYPTYYWCDTLIQSENIIHHHKYRDRSDVIAARKTAWALRNQ